MTKLAPTDDTLAICLSAEELADALSDFSSGLDAVRMLAKPQFQEICNYLGFPLLIYVENTYVDKGYLDDYCTFYAKANFPYARYCRRVHFFRDVGAKEPMEEYLTGHCDEEQASEQENLLNDCYAGYMVVKPLPHAFIGRTCLLPKTGDESALRVGRQNHVMVAGLRLSVDALPYQEQDAAVAACASSALWCALQGIMDDFRIRAPSLSAITLLGSQQAGTQRTMPSGGLTIQQVVHALKQLGLDPDVRTNPETFVRTKGFLYGYLSLGIPVLMAIQSENNDLNEAPQVHLVTIAGFRKAAKNRRGRAKKGKAFEESEAISDLILHDDQRGPYRAARLLSDSQIVIVGTDGANYTQDIRAMIAPIYHKIRVPYEAAYQKILDFNRLFQPGTVSWDLRLSTVKDFKLDVREHGASSADELSRSLHKHYPRFLWVATGILRSGSRVAPVCHVVMDATAVANHFFVLDIVSLHPMFEQNLKVLCSHDLESLLGGVEFSDPVGWAHFLQKFYTPAG